MHARSVRRLANRRWVAAILGVVTLVLVATWAHASATPAAYRPGPTGPDRLVTNEFAHWNPGDQRARRSPDWDVTSGSLFVRDGVGWTGRPDVISPDASSANGTDSSVFRMTTRRHDFTAATIRLRVRNIGLTSVGSAAPSEVDGIHLFLRWQSESDLYVVSLNRRDDQLVVKKKLPGGDVNGGTYHTLAQVRYKVPYGVWQTFTVRIGDPRPGAVDIAIADATGPVLSTVDDGRGSPVIDRPGAIGLRGDNCEFEFANLTVVPDA
jgi:hypothetical protein